MDVSRKIVFGSTLSAVVSCLVLAAVVLGVNDLSAPTFAQHETRNQVTIAITSIFGSEIARDSSVSISWRSQSSPSDSSVALELADANSGASEGLTALSLRPMGMLTWRVPIDHDPYGNLTGCFPDSLEVCGSRLVNGRKYVVTAKLYSPTNADFGGGLPHKIIHRPTYVAVATSSSFILAP
jgi:hypothetical protein